MDLFKRFGSDVECKKAADSRNASKMCFAVLTINNGELSGMSEIRSTLAKTLCMHRATRALFLLLLYSYIMHRTPY